MTHTGNAGCQCDAIRLQIDGDPVTVMQCHCTDCQKSAGGGAVLIALFQRENVSLLSGDPSGHSVTGASGCAVRRRFCPDCGAPIFTELEKFPSLLGIRSGVWDVDQGFAPACAIWTGSAPGWHHIPADIPGFPEGRPTS